MTKLTYRGHSYEPSSNALEKDHQSISLSYRGVKFEYQSQVSPLAYENQHNQRMMKVIYRGQSVDGTQGEVKVKYRGADYLMPSFSVLPININRGLKYRGSTY